MPSVLRLAGRMRRPQYQASNIRLLALQTSSGCPRCFSSFSPGDTFTWAAELCNTLHQAGVPWYLTIPTIALGFNVAVRFPLMYYNRTLESRRTKLLPLVTAWLVRYGLDLRRQKGLDFTTAKARLLIAKDTLRARRQVFRSFGVQRWKTWATIPPSLAPIVIMSGGIRRLCSDAEIDSSDSATPLQSMTEAEYADALHTASTSLHDGGCLWFTDLAVADPYYALPLLCSGLLLVQIVGRYPKERLRELLIPKQDTTQAKLQVSPFERLVERIPFLIPFIPLTASAFPSAIFLYWASSFALNIANDFIITRLVPVERLQSRPAAPKPRTLFLPYLRK